MGGFVFIELMRPLTNCPAWIVFGAISITSFGAHAVVEVWGKWVMRWWDGAVARSRDKWDTAQLLGTLNDDRIAASRTKGVRLGKDVRALALSVLSGTPPARDEIHALRTALVHLEGEVALVEILEQRVARAVAHAKAYDARLRRYGTAISAVSHLLVRGLTFVDSVLPDPPVWNHTAASPSIKAPPGARLGRFLKFWCSSTTYEEVVWPTLADMHREYFKALDEGQRLKAHWEHAKGVIMVLRQVGLFSFIDFIARWRR
ncbi:MAG: hypothetical protein R3B72_51835 [Polyangiaceae bacterium]